MSQAVTVPPGLLMRRITALMRLSCAALKLFFYARGIAHLFAEPAQRLFFFFGYDSERSTSRILFFACSGKRFFLPAAQSPAQRVWK